MKGQITKHEWDVVHNQFTGIVSAIICTHCKCRKKFELGQLAYMPAGKSNWQAQEPDCITRKTNTNGEDSNKA